MLLDDTRGRDGLMRYAYDSTGVSTHNSDRRFDEPRCMYSSTSM